MARSEAIDTALSKNRTTAEYLFEQLKRDIVVGNVAAGQRLVERELTERFGVSRTPVRDALKLLVRTELAVNTPYRGVVVRQLSLEFARDLYDLRRGIEGIAAMLAAERATEDELSHIEQLCAKIRDLSAEGRRDDVMLLNHDFHHAIAEATHNAMLVDRIDELWTNVSLVRGAVWRGNRRTAGSTQEHEMILRAILARDGAAARDAADTHIRNSWTLVEVAMRSAEDDCEPTGGLDADGRETNHAVTDRAAT